MFFINEYFRGCSTVAVYKEIKALSKMLKALILLVAEVRNQ
jgi:hypothetical protein